MLSQKRFNADANLFVQSIEAIMLAGDDHQTDHDRQHCQPLQLRAQPHAETGPAFVSGRDGIHSLFLKSKTERRRDRRTERTSRSLPFLRLSLSLSLRLFVFR